MILDGHAHLDLEERITAADYVRVMKASSVDRVVLMAGLNSRIPQTPEWKTALFRFLLRSRLRPAGRRIYESLVKTGNLKGGGHTIRIIHDPDNDSVAQALAEYPEHFLGFVVVNPRLANAMEILEKGIEEQGMVGVKCHAWWHQVDLAGEFLPIARQCEARGLPVLVHLGGGPRTGNFQGLLERCPRLKLILAHAALPYFEEAWERIREEKSCFVDISGAYLNASLAHETVRVLGPHKVIFGSDGPVSLRMPGGGYSYEAILRWVLDLPLRDRDKERILHRNLERILP